MTAALVSFTKPRARKTYRCEYCRRPIWRGERYEYVTGLWEGQWFTEHRCIQCTVLWPIAFWYWKAEPEDELDCVESILEAAQGGVHLQPMVAAEGIRTQWGTAVPAESGEAGR